MNEPAETTSSIQVRDIDHLGIVAGIVDDIELVKTIDRLLGTHPLEHLSCGQAVKAMILNGLGFLSAPLYLFEEFFVGKPTEHLIGPGVEPEHLNDDRLGRVLDRLFEADLTKVFVQVALEAADRFGVGTRSVHLDATSFHLHGKYGGGGGGGGDGDDDEQEEEESHQSPIRITHGYSRDHRPDLKQFVVDLMTSKDGGIPLFFRVADGNEADQAMFAQLLRAFKAQIDLEDALFVADSALYSAQSLDSLRGLKWLCRVPLTIKEAKETLSGIAEEERFITPSEPALAGYKIYETTSDYGEVEQRWLVVQSEDLKAKALSKLRKKLRRLEEELGKKLKTLKRKRFGCEADARKAAAEFAGGLAYHQLNGLRIVSVNSPGKAGRPGTSSKEGESSGSPPAPPRLTYRIEARLLEEEAKVAEARRASGRFILATSVLDNEELKSEELLAEYKGKDRVERGFRFLKDPLFFTASVFVKSPRRVGAIAMVMSLCLLVYALGERSLRGALAEANACVRHQSGKKTRKPTLRWIFQMFQAVHVLEMGGEKQITNLNEERRSILGFLGRSCERYYLIR